VKGALRSSALALAALVLAVPTAARATGYTDIGDDIRAHEKLSVELDGYLRTRGEALYNLDLDRGLLPSGQPLYPVPLGEPKGQFLVNGDMRLRTDLAFYAPGGGVAVKVRLDTLDNMALGSRPEGVPYASLTQRPTGTLFSLRRAYGEALLPFGLLAAGRMGNHFGLGMFGVVGWSIAIPTLIGVAAGLWIDKTFPSRFSWTLMLLIAGIALGCMNGWYWVKKARDQIMEE
jgi:ATP synthase protein I